jgi:8-amino-7-oxononanoate synthase
LGPEGWVEGELARLRERHLDRRLTVSGGGGGRCRIEGREYLNFSSNDYLDLATDPAVVAAAMRETEAGGAGATASRLMAGNLACHEELERRLAALKGYPAALLFGSGYLANVGVVPALVGRHDRVFADRLVHASLIDGVTLSGARLQRFRHNDPGHLAELLRAAPAGGRRLVVTESVFSMDGDLAPLPALAAAAAGGDALFLVDEAHALGVFGPAGSGLVSEENLQGRVQIAMGTLSKALGSYGGFVACSTALRELLVSTARAFIFTTGLPPAAAGAALGSLDRLAADPDRGSRLLALAGAFRDALRAEGLDPAGSASQIVPVIVGDNEKALAVSRRLREAGVIAVAVRPPTVPAGTARLRFSVTLAHTREELLRTARLTREALEAEGVR